MRGRVADVLSGEAIECMPERVGIGQHYAFNELYPVGRIMRTQILAVVFHHHHQQTTTSNVEAANVAVADDGVRMTLNELLVLEVTAAVHPAWFGVTNTA
jgi:hypothetical protein